jgi:hypothetical protein
MLIRAAPNAPLNGYSIQRTGPRAQCFGSARTHSSKVPDLFVILNGVDLMTLDDRYSTYHEHPSVDTLNDLFSACRDYAVRLSSGYPEEDRATIAQIAVTRAWTALGSYRGSTRFSSWFHTMASCVVQEAHTVREACIRPISLIPRPSRTDQLLW